MFAASWKVQVSFCNKCITEVQQSTRELRLYVGFSNYSYLYYFYYLVFLFLLFTSFILLFVTFLIPAFADTHIFYPTLQSVQC